MIDHDLFKDAFPYREDLLALPVTNIDTAAAWYANAFGLKEIERHRTPCHAIVMERGGARIGFAVNGGDASQDGAAILVSDIDQARKEVAASDAKVGALQTEERDGQTFRTFFVIAPDGLCYYFHQPVPVDDTRS